jgi:hypothetical protein
MTLSGSVIWRTRVDNVLLLEPKETPSNRSARSPKLVVEPTLLLTIEVDFTLLVEPTDDVDVVVDADPSVDEPG